MTSCLINPQQPKAAHVKPATKRVSGGRQEDEAIYETALPFPLDDNPGPRIGAFTKRLRKGHILGNIPTRQV